MENFGNSLKNLTADILSNSNFISRTIGMSDSYDDIMFIVQALGREPISLLGKNYAFIYDHVRRNYLQGMDTPIKDYDGCNKFTFYKEVPTVKFADPYNDPMNLIDRWFPSFETLDTSINDTTLHYSESNDNSTNDRVIENMSNLEFANPGTAHGSIESYKPTIKACDMIGKTNSNFNHGKYQTLITRFHTNTEESKSQSDPTQSANTKKYGLSHGRNLLKVKPSPHNGYDNPYCRVWTYQHQYNQILRQIRPFAVDGNPLTEEELEKEELFDNYTTVGFRTEKNTTLGFDGGSKRLDDYGVLNYSNGRVNIAPTAKIADYFDHTSNEYDKGKISTKKCMFSIENLAWKDKRSKIDEYEKGGLSPEQRGPFGGRIMWFPPYDLKFNESVKVDWNSNKFIGRGENIYTYTNTERSGNLSFTLLIDHPSILDYWTGHERNGMKSKLGKLDPKNSGGVDNIYNQENTLLRFFAGCEVLSAIPQKYYNKSEKPTEEKKEEIKIDPITTPPAVDEVEKEKHVICAVLYYPNNYSGKNDRYGEVDPVHYLMNGIGAQMRVNEYTKLAEDIPTDINHKAYIRVGETQKFGYGGYEVGDYGVSIVDEYLNPNYDDIKKTYADLTSNEKKAQYLTDKDGNKIMGYYDDDTIHADNIYLAKIIGDKAMSLTNAKVEKNLTGSTHQWYRRRYYYRCDDEYANQKFDNRMSYIDSNSSKLNHSGFNIVRTKGIAKAFGIEDDSSEYKLMSFTDLFVAMEGNTVVKPNSSDNVKKIKDIFTNKDKYSNIKISFKGHASYQGYSSSNNDLAKNRALTLKNWLDGFDVTNGVEMGNVEILKQSQEEHVKEEANVGNVDAQTVKLWRSASVVIEYEVNKTENPTMTEPIKEAVDKDGKTTETIVKTEVKTKETSKNSVLSAYEFLHNTAEGQNILSAFPELDKKGTSLTMQDIIDITGEDDFGYNVDYRTREQKDDITSGIVNRYDNEGEFFEVLTKESPFLHHLITDKIKYFDPAFHAISPEGFNARLTFLHQCTRQGSTVEASAFGESTAYNLAFGRPPVCVLRLGDFYYTKIIINSLDIQYENPQWDMNPEGIGMMPMFATINIQFTFLGGSDLAGPIARLQNAVSFNYYANTSVYDDRAEMVKYDDSGNGNEVQFKGYVYPNLTGGASVGKGTMSEILKDDKK